MGFEPMRAIRQWCCRPLRSTTSDTDPMLGPTITQHILAELEISVGS